MGIFSDVRVNIRTLLFPVERTWPDILHRRLSPIMQDAETIFVDLLRKHVDELDPRVVRNAARKLFKLEF